VKNFLKLKKKSKGEIIVVVGGSGQLGKISVKTLLENGFKVINLDLVNTKFRSKSYYFYKVDITNEKAVIEVSKKILKKFKKLKGLINHSHYKGGRLLNNKSSFFSKFEKYPYNEWLAAINVNLNGLFLTTKYLLPILLKNKNSVIINTSSTYGKVSPNKDIYGNSKINSPISYATTKSAIIGFTKYLSTHYAKKGVRANILIPGGIKNKKHKLKFIKNYSKLTPNGRMSFSWEYSDAILFLVSDSSSYMNGSEFVVDGGWTAW
tara:strand:+ start:1412 stop:2203 length:792 start_codon:yes stop_codon:yes gene_type:complete